MTAASPRGIVVDDREDRPRADEERVSMGFFRPRPDPGAVDADTEIEPTDDIDLDDDLDGGPDFEDEQGTDPVSR